ncbi:hypothetical protein DM860_010769 [Cuscuta australis]|uniref:PRONE domain-containing protein n=1 Tax=Cuscuta australis TaxID=267555 RepID=A0A328E002_9ASTE|nr:hypothetical protein DM860_010769 [Cuscuta australis]
MSKRREDSDMSESLIDSSSRGSSYSESSSDESRRKESCSSPSPFGWPIRNAQSARCSRKGGAEKQMQALMDQNEHGDDSELKKLHSKTTEMEMMKERFSKLLLGEDMSGCGKGVPTALAISNAITNLCATVFGQFWRLEPFLPEKISMWRREIEWLVSVSDHIVELIPSWQTLPDGSKVEVMSSRPRLDIFINLPALKKLDTMLIEIVESFTSTEFWYVDKGLGGGDKGGSVNFFVKEAVSRQEDKWWLPVPRVPAGGLPVSTRRQLDHKRECTSQILKAAMAINSSTLAEMEVPESYLDSLPKNGRACLGDVVYRYITSDNFLPECLLDCIDLTSEHMALEMANRVEAAIHVWRRSHNHNHNHNHHHHNHTRPPTHPNRSTPKSSWGIVKDLVVDGDCRRDLLAERAENLLLCLKQRFPNLTQTTLDATKIHCNKDVGKSILESYSRVLESVAFNILARIDDLIHVDDIAKHPAGKPPPTPLAAPHRKLIISSSATPLKSPGPPLISPARGAEVTPFLGGGGGNNKLPRRGLGVKRALSNYLGGEATNNKMKAGSCGNPLEAFAASSISSKSSESRASMAAMVAQDESSVLRPINR